MSFNLAVTFMVALSLGACAPGVGTRVDPGGAPPRPERPQPPVERTQSLVIKGAMAYRERIALPPGASAIVELREGTGGEGSVVAEWRAALQGRQVPIAFEWAVDRAKLAADTRHALRGAILVGVRPAWVTEPVAIDPSSAAIDVGLLQLVRVQPLHDGVETGLDDDGLRAGADAAGTALLRPAGAGASVHDRRRRRAGAACCRRRHDHRAAAVTAMCSGQVRLNGVLARYWRPRFSGVRPV